VLFFISNAYAQGTTAAEGGGGDLLSILKQIAPMIAIFVVMFFLMIRPNMKKQKELRNLIDNIAKGDEIVTAGGLIGKVVSVKDGNVELQIAKDVEVLLQKAAVTQVLPKGTVRL